MSRDARIRNLRPAEPANVLALKHGATSERQIAPRARNHRRRLLRQLRLSPRDLDPLARGYLDTYVRLTSKLDLIDAYLAEHGLIRPDGELQPVMRAYVSIANGARLALSRLEEHLARRGDRGDPLASYLAENYPGGRDGNG